MRASIAAAVLCFFVFALALAATPQWHERLHGLSDVTHHECAATLISSGNCDHFSPDAILAAPLQPRTTELGISRQSTLVLGPLDFALLEHAPPTNS